MNYKDYYELCKKKYIDDKNIIIKTKIDLDNLGIYISDLDNKNENLLEFPNNYLDIINSIYKKVKYKIDNKIDLYRDKYFCLTKVDNFWDIKEIIDLGNIFCKSLEKNMYKSYAIVEHINIYENNFTKKKHNSWKWHIDDNVNEQIKLIVYLTNVNKYNGAFEVLSNCINNVYKFKSSRISFKVNKIKNFENPRNSYSRIPDNIFNKILSKGFKPKKIIGNKGTCILFDPNCIHRATIPTELPKRCIICYNFRPYHKNLQNKVSKKFTTTWSNTEIKKHFRTDLNF